MNTDDVDVLGVPPEESSPPVVPTHVVVAQSRGWAWVRPVDPETGQPQGSGGGLDAPRFQLRPGVHCVVGDRVRVEDAYVTGVADRALCLKRAVRDGEQILAANVDRVVVVLAVNKGLLREGFLMRSVVACTLLRLDLLAVLNKMDLDAHGEGQERLTLWQNLGIRCLGTSTVTSQGMEILARELASGTTALLGQSGVGKSTLLNLLRPGTNRRTAHLDREGRGRHTTTLAEGIVAAGSMIVDLPGVRELGLAGATPDSVLTAFPDIAEALEQCRFPTCGHVDDEGCGVQAAMDAGRLSPRRVALWQRIRDSVAMGLEGGGRY